MYSKILGTGSYLPKNVRTNADLEKMVDTTNEWIIERTGIEERRIASAEETTSYMGWKAGFREGTRSLRSESRRSRSDPGGNFNS